jgi:hypothetical protein
MKKLQRFCAVIALTLAFSLSTFAGEMSTPGDVPPPPPPPPQNQVATTSNTDSSATTAPGEISTPSATVVDPVTEIASTLVESVLSIF